MNKQQFLDELKKLLCGLPTEDINKSLEYYGEMIDDRIEDGVAEEDAVSDIGDPQEIAKQILMDIPMTKLVKAKAKPARALHAWEIALLAAGSPVWVSLLVAAAVVALAIFIVLGAIIVSLYAVVAALGVCGLVSIACAVVCIVFVKIPQGLALLGAGLVLAGLTILLFMLFNIAVKYLVILCKKIWLLIKSCFIRKGECNEIC